MLLLCREFGAHMEPAEYAVVPPILFVFSTTNTSYPIKAEVSAAVIPADPEPRTRMSTFDGNCNFCVIT